MSAYGKLRRKRQLFVDAYVRTGVGSTAAVESGYSGKRPDVAGSQILANPEVKAAIREREEEAIARAGARRVKFIETLCYRAYIAGTEVRDAKGERVTFDKMSPNLLAAIESIEFEADGSIKRIKLSTNSALRMLGETLKAFAQVHEHTGKDGAPIETKDVTEVTDLEKARRVAHLLMQGLRATRPASPLSEDDEASVPAPPVSGDESDV
jgi:phage terminase small subunit